MKSILPELLPELMEDERGFNKMYDMTRHDVAWRTGKAQNTESDGEERQVGYDAEFGPASRS